MEYKTSPKHTQDPPDESVGFAVLPPPENTPQDPPPGGESPLLDVRKHLNIAPPNSPKNEENEVEWEKSQEKYWGLREASVRIGSRMVWARIPEGEAVRRCREIMVTETCGRTGKRRRFSTSSCRNRFCPSCSREKGARIGSRLKEAHKAVEGHAYLVTLTFKNTERLMPFDYYRACFTKLRRRKFWKEWGGIMGGVVGFEVTINPKTGEWHSHFHAVIYTGDEVPTYGEEAKMSKNRWKLEHTNRLSSEWRDVTGDSFIVDARKFDGSFQEVLKYITKPLDTLPDNQESDEKLRELYAFSRGRRMTQTFGHLFDVDLSDDDPLQDEMECGCHSHPVEVHRCNTRGDEVLLNIGVRYKRGGRYVTEWALTKDEPKPPGG